MRRSLLFLIFVFLSSSTPVSMGVSLRTNELILTGGRCESEGLSASGMCLWLRRGEPGVAFGMTTQPGATPTLGYVLLIKGDPGRRSLAGHNITSYSDGRTAKGGGHVEINGNRADIEHRLERKDKEQAGWLESLSICGKSFDLKQGRVFLIDLSGTAVTTTQIQSELPPCPAMLRTTEEVERLAKLLIKRLRPSATVRAFLK